MSVKRCRRRGPGADLVETLESLVKAVSSHVATAATLLDVLVEQPLRVLMDEETAYSLSSYTSPENEKEAVTQPFFELSLWYVGTLADELLADHRSKGGIDTAAASLCQRVLSPNFMTLMANVASKAPQRQDFQGHAMRVMIQLVQLYNAVLDATSTDAAMPLLDFSADPLRGAALRIQQLLGEMEPKPASKKTGPKKKKAGKSSDGFHDAGTQKAVELLLMIERAQAHSAVVAAQRRKAVEAAQPSPDAAFASLAATNERLLRLYSGSEAMRTFLPQEGTVKRGKRAKVPRTLMLPAWLSVIPEEQRPSFNEQYEVHASTPLQRSVGKIHVPHAAALEVSLTSDIDLEEHLGVVLTSDLKGEDVLVTYGGGSKADSTMPSTLLPGDTVYLHYPLPVGRVLGIGSSSALGIAKASHRSPCCPYRSSMAPLLPAFAPPRWPLAG